MLRFPHGRIPLLAGFLAGMQLFLQVSPASAQAGTFQELHRMVPFDADKTEAIVLDDVDGDQDLDVLLGNNGSSLQDDNLYRNDGAGVFVDVSTVNLPLNAFPTHALSTGDVDGDQNPDVFVGVGGLNRLYLNDGTGVFLDVTATNLPSLSESTLGVALGDLDGDQDLDAWIGNSGLNRIYRNDGTGVFSDVTQSHLPPATQNTQSIALGDVDGDQDLDVLTGNAAQQDRLYLNDGTGTFSDATFTNLPLHMDNTRCVLLGDVDGDQDLDALIGNGGQDLLYRNDGTGVFTDVTPTNLPPLSNSTKAVALGDVDGDQDLDALFGTAGSNRLYRNDGTGVFTDVTDASLPSGPVSAGAVALGDVDGDQDLDAVIGTLGTQTLLRLNDGTGVFRDVTAPQLPLLPGTPTEDLVLGDVDGDQDLDALIGNRGAQDRLLVNDSAGIFSDATATKLPADADPTASVALGDLDGDQDLDALVGNEGVQNRLYANDGTGGFTDVTSMSLPVDVDPTVSLALGDVDGDQDLDALLGNNGTHNRLYRNDGAGVLSDVTATNLPLDTDRTGAVSLGDVDGDQDLDAVLGNDSSMTRLYRNDGMGVFTDVTATNLPPNATRTGALDLGDVDGDLDLDVMIGSNGSRNLLFLNDGTGMFSDGTATNMPLDFDPTTALVLGDVDGDQDLDAWVGNNGAQNRLYANTGTGFFIDLTGTRLPLDSERTKALGLEDVDGDQDLDAFVGNFLFQNRLDTNLTHQLASRSVPRVGQPLTFDLFGRSGSTWLLLVSPMSASISLPFGTLRLDPTTTLAAGSGLLAFPGTASVAFPIPSNPALVGVTLYWQAVLGFPLELSNLEPTAFTSL